VEWPTLETDRLVLRPLASGDLDSLAELHAQESFWWFPSRRGWSRGESQAFLERTVERYADPGMAVSAVVIRATGRLAGWAGLSVPTFLPEILPAVELGWRLGEQYRGCGYATEAGEAWVRYGFEQLDLDRIVSIHEPDNVASGAVAQRLGFVLDRETTHPRPGVRVRVLALDRAVWGSRPGAPRT
jgi:RimJ/RimL family protein N-acetyltransferase